MNASVAKRGSRRSRGRATIADVAREAGVSPMTVSRVINAGDNVRPDTRERVEAAIRALSFSPNVAARSLASADVIRIGLLYNNPSASYLSELLVGALEEASKVGGQVLVERCGSGSSEGPAVEKLLDAGADGIILPPPLCDSVGTLELLASAGVPTVAVATGRPRAGALSVRIDDFEAARAITTHLIELGHSCIGFIKGHPNQTASAERLEGFLAALKEGGIKPGVGWVQQGYFTYRSGLTATERLLALDPRPTAIFASNDDMAAGAASIIHRMALDVPGDVSVVGFDDTQIALAVYPELTTIRQPIAAMGRAAVDMLVEAIRENRRGQPVAPRSTLLRFTLVKRGSASAPAGDQAASSGT